ncbi:YrvL family regulatory protein [Radiobacillus deserti]|uniref:Regulatory protein YrvL n=1 Tax=Radiobacillus deserti TaxID=2594883 RepID=A0A516KDP5_9BACI|nr:YrvL family regulatory protein [Radiobacillus deserti]QDP39519.1 hypothetical protein FN924_04610 [Radiobacillus deserti]
MNIKEKIATVVGILILCILVIGFLFCLYFFGMAGILKLLGVQYESVWSLVLFVTSFFILGIVVELFSKAIFTLSVQNITGRVKILFIRICIESISNWFVLFTVDAFMQSIALSTEIEVVIACLVAVVEIAFDNDKD